MSASLLERLSRLIFVIVVICLSREMPGLNVVRPRFFRFTSFPVHYSLSSNRSTLLFLIHWQRKAVPYFKWLASVFALWGLMFKSRGVRRGFVSDKVALGQMLLPVFGFYHASVVPPVFHCLIISGWDNRHICVLGTNRLLLTRPQD